MWWPTHARPPLATPKVFLSSAPQASSGACASTGSADRAPARTRASGAARCGRPPATRTTESSVRVSIGRSCSRNTSAIPQSRSRASSSRYAIGSSDTFPLVITSGRPTSASSRWWSGEYGQHHAELARRAARPRPPPRVRPRGARARSAARGDSSSRSSARLQLDQLARAREVRRHQRERLVLAVLARAQRRHGRARRPRGRRGGSRPAPSRDDRARRAAPRAAPSSASRTARRRPPAAPRDRSPGRRSAARGSGGRAGPRTRAGTPAHIAKPAIVVFGRS